MRSVVLTAEALRAELKRFKEENCEELRHLIRGELAAFADRLHICGGPAPDVGATSSSGVRRFAPARALGINVSFDAFGNNQPKEGSNGALPLDSASASEADAPRASMFPWQPTEAVSDPPLRGPRISKVGFQLAGVTEDVARQESEHDPTASWAAGHGAQPSKRSSVRSNPGALEGSTNWVMMRKSYRFRNSNTSSTKPEGAGVSSRASVELVQRVSVVRPEISSYTPLSIAAAPRVDSRQPFLQDTDEEGEEVVDLDADGNRNDAVRNASTASRRDHSMFEVGMDLEKFQRAMEQEQSERETPRMTAHNPAWKKAMDLRNIDGTMGEISDVEGSEFWSCCACLLAPISKFVISARFDYTVGCIILANAISIGVHTDYMARNGGEEPFFFRVTAWVFCAIYILEMLLRIAVQGCLGFFSKDWLNIFDFVAVTLQVVEETMGLFVGSYSLATYDFGVVRILRVLRFVRIVSTTARIFHLIAELRMMVVSIFDSMRYLAWTIFLLLLVTFMFGVLLTQLATDHKERVTKVKQQQELTRFFGSLDRTLLSLYEAVSDGIHWHEVMDPLAEACSPWIAILFILYMSFALFALTNVVTGVFVESAIHTAEEDKKHALMCQMYKLFRDADSDNSGTISWREFQEHLEDENMQMFLSAIDLDQDEARSLFHLLDVEESGEIDAELIVSGCMRLHGSAKAIELAAFMAEYRRTMKNWQNHAKLVEDSLAWICDMIKPMAIQSAISTQRR